MVNTSAHSKSLSLPFNLALQISLPSSLSLTQLRLWLPTQTSSPITGGYANSSPTQAAIMRLSVQPLRLDVISELLGPFNR